MAVTNEDCDGTYMGGVHDITDESWAYLSGYVWGFETPHSYKIYSLKFGG